MDILMDRSAWIWSNRDRGLVAFANYPSTSQRPKFKPPCAQSERACCITIIRKAPNHHDRRPLHLARGCGRLPRGRRAVASFDRETHVRTWRISKTGIHFTAPVRLVPEPASRLYAKPQACRLTLPRCCAFSAPALAYHSHSHSAPCAFLEGGPLGPNPQAFSCHQANAQAATPHLRSRPQPSVPTPRRDCTARANLKSPSSIRFRYVRRFELNFGSFTAPKRLKSGFDFTRPGK